MRFNHADLERFTEELFSRAGETPEYSKIIARLLVRADLSGYPGHGVSRVPSYVSRLKSGVTVPGAKWRVLHEGRSTVALDANGCAGQVVSHNGMSIAIAKARGHGVGVVTISHASHVGRLADYVEQAADEGMVGFAAVSVGSGNVAPHGAMEPATGTNPIAFGIPARGGRHIVVDYATSAISASEIRRRATDSGGGEGIPEGILLDSNGMPTVSYSAFRGPPRGVILTFGGYKGYALNLVAEVLGGLLSGNGLGRDWVGRSQGGGPANGVYLQAVRVDEFQPIDRFYESVDELAAFVRSRRPAPGFKEVLLPGDNSRRKRERAVRDGVGISDETWDELAALAAQLGVSRLPAPLHG